MKKCSKCMAENAVDAKFCKLCSSPLQQGGGKTCPSGRHTMDPSWTECAYCKAESGAAPPRPVANPLPPRPAPPAGAGPRVATRVETMVDGSDAAGVTPPGASRPLVRPPTYREDSPLPPRPAGSGPRPFTPPAPAPPAAPTPPPSMPPQGRRTVYGTPSPSLPSVTKARKIVGLLVTYSWRPEGQVYEVREGRNLIGRDPSCDICVTEDETMSATNSHITFRQSFVIGDMVSMMGTDVNGIPIEQQFTSLDSHSLVRAGSTHFTFIAVELRKPQAPEA